MLHCILSLTFTFYYNCSHTATTHAKWTHKCVDSLKIWVLTCCETCWNSGSHLTAGQAVPVLQWSADYPYHPVSIVHNFTSILSKKQWYQPVPEPCETEQLKKFSRVCPLLRTFHKALKIPVFICWHNISILNKDYIMNSARCMRQHYFLHFHFIYQNYVCLVWSIFLSCLLIFST